MKVQSRKKSLEVLVVVPVLEGEFVDVVHGDLADTAGGHVEGPEVPHRGLKHEQGKQIQVRTVRNDADILLRRVEDLKQQLFHPRHALVELFALRDDDFFRMAEEIPTVCRSETFFECLRLPASPVYVYCQRLCHVFAIFMVFIDGLCCLSCPHNL